MGAGWCVVVRLFGCVVVMWLFGDVVMWLCGGYVVAWLCGRVVLAWLGGVVWCGGWLVFRRALNVLFDPRVHLDIRCVVDPGSGGGTGVAAP